ncbi:MAG: hypothetical protein LPK45_04810 [Bacteroidota bacterium]|nr:hypothetical protein [Bacteroidota bacterium]MDX5430377.1 hypothetical protein [Bacteroidota bacterium]MDX5469138.1 hypothetical protein [Bacteroidota bacterium]
MKKYFAKRAIRHAAKTNSKRERTIRALGAGIKIGIVFQAEDPAQRSLMEKMREELVKEGALVSLTGYFTTKEFPEKLVFKPGFDYLKKQDLDWKGLPNDSVIQKLNASNLDILISLSAEEDFALLSLAARSKAGYRIGAYFPAYTSCFDFMLDLGDKKTNDNLVKLCLHYLKHIKQ